MEEKGTGSSERTRHVHILYFWVKDRIAAKGIEVIFMSTDDMIADILTKPLQCEKIVALRNKLLNWKC